MKLLKEQEFLVIQKLVNSLKEKEHKFSKQDFENQLESWKNYVFAYLKIQWPNVKCFRLEYKNEEDKDNLKDTYAFYLGKDYPEIYLILTSQGPLIFDENKFDAYDKSPFKKPDWDKE